MSVHGNRSLQNNFLLDGVDNNSISTNVQELSTQVSRPSIDAIDEFKVVTSPFAAEYGRAPGGAIIVTTKSGTNAFFGTAYDYFRDERFDSKTLLRHAARRSKKADATTRTSIGFNLGGPILQEPGLLLRRRRGDSHHAGRPAQRARADRWRSAPASSPRHVRDPLTGLPFADNAIPADRIDPMAPGRSSP